MTVIEPRARAPDDETRTTFGGARFARSFATHGRHTVSEGVTERCALNRFSSRTDFIANWRVAQRRQYENACEYNAARGGNVSSKRKGLKRATRISEYLKAASLRPNCSVIRHWLHPAA